MSDASQPDFDEAIHQRGVLGILMLVVPIVSVMAVGSAYLGLAYLGWQGRGGSGEVVRIDFEGCAAAQEGVAERVAFMGLRDPSFKPTGAGFSLEVVLPLDPDAAADIPTTLAARGEMGIYPLDGEEAVITNGDVKETTVELPFLDAPHAILVLTEEGAGRLRAHMEGDPGGAIEVRLDGASVYKRRNSPVPTKRRLAIDQPGETDLDRMLFAARFAATMQGAPLPCDLTVASVTPRRASE